MKEIEAKILIEQEKTKRVRINRDLWKHRDNALGKLGVVIMAILLLITFIGAFIINL